MNQTCLHPAHLSVRARMVDFGGWDMPLLYTGIIDEHRHTRTVASIFDVSHMGRLFLQGPDAEHVLQLACTRNVAKLAVGRCGYSHICNTSGGILDDVIVSRYPDRWLVVCNAGNRDKIVRHLHDLLADANATMTDDTLETAMIAMQGPRSWETLKSDLPLGIDADPSNLKRYAFVSGELMGVPYSLFRTGYTGEDGFELVVPANVGLTVWNFLLECDQRGGPQVKPAGLGARDTLRLEAGMPLYGHELGEDVDPLSAGCQWCVDLTKDFIGVQELRRIAANNPMRKLVGLILEGRRIARQGANVIDNTGKTVGTITSGTQSPTLEKAIAMAYVDAGATGAGTMLEVDLGNCTTPAAVTALPFYKRPT